MVSLRGGVVFLAVIGAVYFDKRRINKPRPSLTRMEHPRHDIRNTNYFSIYEIFMKIGPLKYSSTAICASNAETILIRGHDLCEELIGQVGFTDYVWLLVEGKLPTPEQRRVLDSTLVAIAEHGLVPSVQVSRMTLAAAPEALQGAVAAGILGCGSVILGAAENAGRMFAAVEERARQPTVGLDAASREVLLEYNNAGRAVPGYGHPLHKGLDPRAAKLIAVSRQSNCAGRHVEISQIIEGLIPEVIGKPLVLNISGAISAVLLDAGFPLLALKGVPILARTAGLIAHLLEEQQRPLGFALSHAGASAISYDGPAPDGFHANDH
jgi:citrate synthase